MAGIGYELRKLLLADCPRADFCFVDDQIAWSDARCDAVAMREGFQRVVARHDRVDTHRARRRIGVELADCPGEELQSPFNRGQVGGAGSRFSFRSRLLGRQAESFIDRPAPARHPAVRPRVAIIWCISVRNCAVRWRWRVIEITSLA